MLIIIIFDDCVKMIKTVDFDEDGCVNFQEFQKMIDANAKNANTTDAAK